MNQPCVDIEEALFLDEPSAPKRRAAPLESASDALSAFAEEAPRRPERTRTGSSQPFLPSPGATLFVEPAGRPDRSLRTPLLVVLLLIGTLTGFFAVTMLLN